MLFLDEGLPVYVTEPGVCLDLSWTIQSEPIRWLPLEQLVNEVCSFHAPALREVLLPQMDLLREDLVSDLFP